MTRKWVYICICAALNSKYICAKNEIQEANETNISQPQGEILDASIISLIANPKLYDNKMVRVTGYLKIEFEGDAVYFHKEDEINRICKNGLWLDLSNCDKESLKAANESYAIIEGVFHSDDLGHTDLFSGAIKSIKRVYPLSDKIYGYDINSAQKEKEIIMTDDSSSGSSKVSNAIDSIIEQDVHKKMNFCITPTPK